MISRPPPMRGFQNTVTNVNAGSPTRPARNSPPASPTHDSVPIATISTDLIEPMISSIPTAVLAIAPILLEILVKVPSKKVFRKWKRYQVSIDHSAIILKQSGNIEQVIRLHRFMWPESPRKAEGVVCIEIPVSEGTRMRKTNSTTLIYKSKLMQNPLSKVQANRRVASGGKFVQRVMNVPVEKVIQFASEDKALLEQFLEQLCFIIPTLRNTCASGTIRSNF